MAMDILFLSIWRHFPPSFFPSTWSMTFFFVESWQYLAKKIKMVGPMFSLNHEFKAKVMLIDMARN